ncbi:MAG: DUF4041 domain-containing protein [Myxococcales bacterium]|nr:DUF4041 domain-containing protein [Myxococcales bacterium]
MSGFCIVMIVLTLAFGGGLVFVLMKLLAAQKDLERFSGIRDVEAAHREVEQKKSAIVDECKSLESERRRFQAEIDKLRREIGTIEETMTMQSFGFYHTRYGFEDIDEYKRRIDDVREQQKTMIKTNQAAATTVSWTVEGSAKKGEKMVKEHAQLMLRAFNGECDAAIAKVKYNNVTNMQTRIEKSFEAISKLGKTKSIEMSKRYLELKIEELLLVHEHREALQEEKERQREIRDQMREEERAQKELEKAQQEAEKDEERYQKALEKARQELAAATGAQHNKLEELVNKLETQLGEAIDRKAKAIARAQLTRSGHVYIISNVGCFGDNFYKIGMTRRLEPHERVYELGGASVPFRFDAHAMIYAEDAPALENALHKEFADRRVNKVNLRKEFFRVTLDELRRAVAKHHGIITFVTYPEAEEYRKTLALEAEADAERESTAARANR